MIQIKINKQDFKDKFDLALKGIALDLQEALKDKLTKAHGKDTGLGQSSIKGKSKNNQVNISMIDYLKNVEFGTPPHLVDPEELQGWVRRKLKAGSKDGDKANMKAAKKLADHIALFGTKPYPFIRNTFRNELIGIIENNLKQAFG